jgi:hypothetical protein
MIMNAYSGLKVPKAAWDRAKYNGSGNYKLAHILATEDAVPYSSKLSAEASKCISAALSRNTWSKYCSAWNAFKKFEIAVQKKFTWPLQENVYAGFATWCIRVKNLSTNTAKAYLTALSTAHSIAGFGSKASKPGELTRLILAGGWNREFTSNRFPTVRRSMNLTVLKITGHRIATSNWSKGTKQVIWAAITTAFFTSARMGELLSPEDHAFDPTTTLQWSRVLFRGDGSILLHIRVPKIPSKEGDFLDLFPFDDKTCCPVLALKRLFLMQNEIGILSKAMPVYRFPSGRNLTLRNLNVILRELLGDIYKKGTDSITCHSLRAAIPTALHESMHNTEHTDTKEWGRWKSNAHRAYTKLQTKHKQHLFGRVTEALTKL